MLFSFLHKYVCLYKKQFGFQNSDLTKIALIITTETVR